jgi:hypothetical protein
MDLSSCCQVHCVVLQVLFYCPGRRCAVAYAFLVIYTLYSVTSLGSLGLRHSRERGTREWVGAEVAPNNYDCLVELDVT